MSCNAMNPNIKLEEVHLWREFRALVKVLWILLLVTLGFDARAQQDWTYTDGNPIFATQIDLSQALPQNGTVDVSPSSIAFSAVSGSTTFAGVFYGQMIYEPGFEPITVPIYQFTAVNGAITAFDVALNMGEPGTNSPTLLQLTLSSQGDTFYEQLTGAACEYTACNPVTASSAPGTWVDPPAHAAPEFDPRKAIEALVLLSGLALILKTRRADQP
jgi:hypothetical protein